MQFKDYYEILGVEPSAGEAEIKTETQATIRNIPFTETTVAGKTCLKCDAAATEMAWFAKAY